MIGYHGTHAIFDEFNASHTHDNVSPYGPGHYFYDNEEDAKRHGPTIIKAELKMTNPIKINAKTTSSLNFDIDAEHAFEILNLHPDIRNTRHSETMSPIAGYIPYYYTVNIVDGTLIRKMAKCQKWDYVSLKHVFKDYPGLFLHALYISYGYDGVLIYDNNHTIYNVWDGRNIRIIEKTLF